MVHGTHVGAGRPCGGEQTYHGGTYIHGLRLPKGRTGTEKRTDERTKATEAQRHRGVQLSAGG